MSSFEANEVKYVSTGVKRDQNLVRNRIFKRFFRHNT